MPAFRHVGYPQLDDGLRGQAVNGLSPEVNLAGQGMQQTGNRSQRGGFAGAVRSEKAYDLSRLYLQGDSVQRHNGPIGYLNIANLKH